MDKKVKQYDPTWLVELAQKGYPEEYWLHNELSKCTNQLLLSDDESMIYFVSPNKPNKTSSEWQHKECIELESYEKGLIVLDILKDNRVGAIELVWLIKDI